MSPQQAASQLAVKESERKYQIFISSTFNDLGEQRRMVLDTVIDRGHIPVSLERFPAADSAVPYVIQKAIENSQLYIIILGFRYGAMANADISFTQLEYQNALTMAERGKMVVVPFFLAEDEVHNERRKLASKLDEERSQFHKLRKGTPEWIRLQQEIKFLEEELKHEKLLWEFRTEVSKNRFARPFSLVRGSSQQFEKHMVLSALLEAEHEAEKRRISGWIREPEGTEVAEAIEAISKNRFLVDVVRAMAKFDSLVPRVLDHPDEKLAAAEFFTEKYLAPLQEKEVNLFFESGSTIAYVANAVGERLGTHEFGREIRISTNNVLAYLIFWLVHGIRCSLFPWGPPEKQYGAVFGRINAWVSERTKPSFPPKPLTQRDLKAIDWLLKEPFGPAGWGQPTLLLGALSGLQLTKDARAFDCLGPHVGSFLNKIFKRFMYETKYPIMFFMTADKIDSAVKPEHCHFILDQDGYSSAESSGAVLRWNMFCTERPVAFCVGCKCSEGGKAARMFLELGFQLLDAQHQTNCTAFIARNQKFIQEFEQGMNIE